MHMATLAIPLVVISKQKKTDTIYGPVEPPLMALCDIGNCLSGKENCLFEFCRRKGASGLLTLILRYFVCMNKHFFSYVFIIGVSSAVTISCLI